jgi:F-type H+-transporting ATPase subunit b
MMFTPEAVAGYTNTAIFTIINLVVTYFFLKRFLFKPILKVLRTRREGIEKQLKEIQENQEAAELQMAEAARRIHLSTREAQELLTAAKSQAEVLSESTLSDARREATAMVVRADGEISRMRVTMLNEVRDEVADLSVAIASKVIGQVLDEHRQRELVEQFLNEKLISQPKKADNIQPQTSAKPDKTNTANTADTADTANTANTANTAVTAVTTGTTDAKVLQDTGNGVRSNG